MRRHFGRGTDAARPGPPQMLDRLERRQMHQVHRLSGLACQVDVAPDHQALAERRPGADAELARHRAGVRMPAACQRRLLAVDRDRAPRHGVVLQGSPHHPGCRHRMPVVGEAGRPGVGKRAELGELRPGLPLREGGEEADRHLRLGLGTCPQSPQERGVVDRRIGVGHREDRAVTAGRGGPRAALDRLLVLAARRPEVDVRIDERRREHQSGSVDDAVPVGVDVDADPADHATVDPHVDRCVDAFDRVEHARTADDEVVVAGRPGEDAHAVSNAAATVTGPAVRRS